MTTKISKVLLIEDNPADFLLLERYLRQQGLEKAAKRSEREATEGVVELYSHGNGRIGVMVEVNSETDFVAKNDEFLKLAADCARLVAEKNPADVAALSALALGEGTVESTRTALVGKIGENMSIRRFVRIEAKGKLASYIHGGSKIGVLVDVAGRAVVRGRGGGAVGARELGVERAARGGEEEHGRDRGESESQQVPHGSLAG